MKKSILITMVTAIALQATPLYNACAGCHGGKAEKKALGKSKVINTMSAKEIEAALKGYQNGTYGGPMKGLMKAQAAKLDDAKIQTLAKYIASLK